MEKKKRKLLIVDVESEEARWSAREEHDKIIKEIQDLHRKHGGSNMQSELWDEMNLVERSTSEEEARPHIAAAHALIAEHFYGARANKLEKLADFLEGKGEVERAESLLKRAQEMRDNPEKFMEEKKAKTDKPKKDKTPVFQSPQKQKDVKLKYTWVIEGTFRQDPDKAGGTIVDIKCNNCGAPRTIHLADAFQVKLCLKCR